MADITTGPISPRSYEALESERLWGVDLLDARGEIGLAVAYDDTTMFRFQGHIMDVTPRSGVDMVHMDVVSLDGLRSYGFSMEAEPESGVIRGRSLPHRPMTDVNGPEPKSAFLYDAAGEKRAELDKLEDGFSGMDAVAFRRLEAAQKEQARQRTARVAHGYGLIPAVKADLAESAPVTGYSARRRSPRLTLIGGVLIVPVPKGKKRQ